jgi:hypothetical protein
MSSNGLQLSGVERLAGGLRENAQKNVGSKHEGRSNGSGGNHDDGRFFRAIFLANGL